MTRLREDEVRVWHAEVTAADAGELTALLSDDERARAERFRSGGARERFVVGRGAARAVLGAALERDPRSLRFVLRCGACGSTDHGKPYVADGHAVEFNVSHSGEVALVALARGRPVGVDVESGLPSLDVGLVARKALTPAERRKLEGLPASKRRAAFLRVWACKEAYLKARGVGLAASWRVHPLRAPAGYAAAVASEGEFEVVAAHLDVSRMRGHG